MRITLNWVFNTFLFGISLVVLIVLLIPHFTHYELLTVLSPSMSPTIPLGSVIILDTEDINTIRVGDIITFQPYEVQEEKITHRVIQVFGNRTNLSYRTQGDSNNAADLDLVSHDSVKGKFLFSIPFIGYVFQFVRLPLGFLVMIIFPASLVIFGEIKEILRIKKGK